MSIIDDIIRALVDRNEIIIRGAVTVGLTDGAVKLTADLRTEIQDKQKNNRPVAKMLIPMSATAKVDEMVIPVRIPRQ